MPTFRELLIEFNMRRINSADNDTKAILGLDWAVQSILERLANWEEFRDNHPKPDND